GTQNIRLFLDVCTCSLLAWYNRGGLLILYEAYCLSDCLTAGRTQFVGSRNKRHSWKSLKYLRVAIVMGWLMHYRSLVKWPKTRRIHVPSILLGRLYTTGTLLKS